MNVSTIRLHPGQDLKKELISFVSKNNIKAGFIVTTVGSLKKAILRMSGTKTIKQFEQTFEIVSFVGTLSQDGLHLHISLSDEHGNVIGGHVKEGCIIYTTAEIVIGTNKNATFSRVFDKNTGFKELIIDKT